MIPTPVRPLHSVSLRLLVHATLIGAELGTVVAIIIMLSILLEDLVPPDSLPGS